jgi:hypothetical protein
MAIQFTVNTDEARQLLGLLNRAVNTLEPILWPPLAVELIAFLEDYLRAPPKESSNGIEQETSRG